MRKGYLKSDNDVYKGEDVSIKKNDVDDERKAVSNSVSRRGISDLVCMWANSLDHYPPRTDNYR